MQIFSGSYQDWTVVETRLFYGGDFSSYNKVQNVASDRYLDFLRWLWREFSLLSCIVL